MAGVAEGLDVRPLEAIDRGNYSELQLARMKADVPGPSVLKGPVTVVRGAEAPHGDDRIATAFPNLQGVRAVRLESSHANGSASRADHAIGASNGTQNGSPSRPLTVGVVLSGGQAPGGHSVIAGLFDQLATQHPGSCLLGFLNGPRGIINCDVREITASAVEPYRQQGGFNIIGSGRDKIESVEHLQAAADTAAKLGLDGLVVIGGDDSNTNAAVLAESFRAKGLKTCVVGVPKTIDGDLKTPEVPISFGFDTACKVYAEMCGNIMIDSASARKYYHFIRLMGRSASHIALEVALQTHPNAALISEEVAARSSTLAEVTNQLADMVAARAAAGKNYGVVLVPEGLIESIPQVGALIGELNELLAVGGNTTTESIAQRLSPASAEVFSMLGSGIHAQLLEERDPHGNVQVAHIQTEVLLLKLVAEELAGRASRGAYSGKFSGLGHYMGYEGRCAMPSNFDCAYTTALGKTAGALVGAGETALMATVGNLGAPASQWTAGGTPLTAMMCIERRKGKDKPVIRKALVDLDGPVFGALAANRAAWAIKDAYRSPGPIQFAGAESAHRANLTLALELGIPTVTLT